MPAARETFKDYRSDNIYSPKFKALSQRLLANFAAVLDTSDDPAALKILLERIKTEYDQMGIQSELYDVFADSLMETLPKYLGSHFDWDAWVPCVKDMLSHLK
jgi:hemoglobin-like flavoprotein